MQARASTGLSGCMGIGGVLGALASGRIAARLGAGRVFWSGLVLAGIAIIGYSRMSDLPGRASAPHRWWRGTRSGQCGHPAPDARRHPTAHDRTRRICDESAIVAGRNLVHGRGRDPDKHRVAGLPRNGRRNQLRPLRHRVRCGRPALHDIRIRLNRALATAPAGAVHNRRHIAPMRPRPDLAILPIGAPEPKPAGALLPYTGPARA